MAKFNKQFNKYVASQKKFINDALKLSAEMKADIEQDNNLGSWSVYANKDCKTCDGRGINEFTHPGNVTLKTKPCDCAIRGKYKLQTEDKINPLYAVKNKDGEFLYYPPLTKLQKHKDVVLVTPKGWEKSEKVVYEN